MPSSEESRLFSTQEFGFSTGGHFAAESDAVPIAYRIRRLKNFSREYAQA